MKIYGFILMLLTSCNNASERFADKSLKVSSFRASDSGDNFKGAPSLNQFLYYKIIVTEDGTFGYDIWKKDKIFIHQPHKPGLPGTRGFAQRGDAEKVARLVIRKIRAGEMLPGITLAEMKKLGIIDF